jgi:hypothetical protein
MMNTEAMLAALDQAKSALEQLEIEMEKANGEKPDTEGPEDVEAPPKGPPMPMMPGKGMMGQE